MPKRKTAETKVGPVVVPEPRKRITTTASKPAATPAAGHKRTTTKRAEPVPPAPVVTPAAPPVETPVEAPVAAAPAIAVVTPEAEQIAILAYSYWEQRGYQHGSAQEDWLRAEQELMKLSQDR